MIVILRRVDIETIILKVGQGLNFLLLLKMLLLYLLKLHVKVMWMLQLVVSSHLIKQTVVVTGRHSELVICGFPRRVAQIVDLLKHYI